MAISEELTNETLASLFNDNFQLAFQSIQLARNEVNAGNETTMQQVLKEIKKNPHLHTFDDTVLGDTQVEKTNQ